MKVYTVKSGQNIFDVAVTLYGSVEGVFDLLVSNDDITFSTQLKAGMELNYHEEFIINSGIVEWFTNNKIKAKNGHKKSEYPIIRSIFLLWLYSYDIDAYNDFISQADDYKENYLSQFDLPKIIINQTGQTCTLGAWLRSSTYMVIDWGDFSAPQVFTNTDEETEILHNYNGSGSHKIQIYGNPSFYSLDFSDINGVYYLLETIVADQFTDTLNNDELKTLFQ